MKHDNRELRIGVIAYLEDPHQEGVPALEAIAQDIADHALDSSNLVFANSRQVVEWQSHRLHQLALERKMSYDPFFSHHGSLSKEVREHTERTLKSGKPVTVLATSSLELGIDIGAVGRVSQIDPPCTVGSLQQRKGRGGRRDGDPSVLRLYTRDYLPIRGATLTSLLYQSLLRGHAMTELLLAGKFEPPGKPKLHLSTLAHQTLSCVRQWGALDPERLYRMLCETGPFRNIDPDLYGDLLRSLKKFELIAQDSEGGIVLAEKGDQITSKYDFYAAFASSEDYTVRHNEHTIGFLRQTELRKCEQFVTFNGRKWRINAIRHREKTVEVSPAEAGTVQPFGGEAGDISSMVFQRMREALRETAVPNYLNPNAARLLQSARETARRAGLTERGVLITDEVLMWFPWLGTRALRTLRLFAQLEKWESEDDGLCLTYKGVTKERFIAHLERLVSGEIDATTLAALMDQKHFQKFDEFLDEKVLNRANGNDRLDLETAQEAAEEALMELRGNHSQVAA